MNLIETVKAFFTSSKADPVAVAALDAFSAASDAYDAAFHAIVDYGTRANHRYAILAAARTLYKAPLDDPSAADAYDDTVAAYTDPEDFNAYTTSYLDAHTAAIETLTTAFDNFTDAFAALKPTYAVYSSAAAVYKATCDTFTFAATAYNNAVHCAMTTALEGNLQAAKDDFKVMLLEMRTANFTEANPAATKAKAAAFKIKAAEDAAKAKALEETAKVAESRAEVFRAKAKTAQAKAEELLQSHAENDA